MINIRKIFVTDLFKVSFLNGIATLIKMLAGLASIKVVAAIIGPSGIALLGQLNNFTQIMLSISNGGIINGITKYLSQTKDSGKKYLFYLGTAFWITLVLSLVSGLIMFVFATYFSNLILHTPEYALVFRIFGVTIVFYAMNALLLAAINGFKEYRKYVKVNIISSLVGLAFSVVLCLYFGLMGALIAAVTSQSVVFVLTLAMVARSRWFQWPALSGMFSRTVLKQLAHFSLMAIVTAIIVPVSQIFVRGFITDFRSVNDAGLWEGMNRVSSMYLYVIMTSLSVYYLPKLAELKTNYEVRNEIINVLKLIIPFMVISGLVIYMLRDQVIHILFTPEFEKMRDLFALQLAADTVKMSSWVLGFVMVARAMTKAYIIMEVLHCTLFVLIGRFLVPVMGGQGAIIGYLVSQLAYLLLVAFILRKVIFAHDAKRDNP